MELAGAFTIQEKGDSKFSLVFNMHASNLQKIIKQIYIMYLHPLREIEKKECHYLLSLSKRI